MSAMRVTLQPFRDRNKMARFRGVAANGEVVFQSEAYRSTNKRNQTMERLAGAILKALPALLVLLLIGCTTCGCKSTQNLSQTEMQARLATLTEQVRLAQIKSGSPVVADFLSNVPESGAAGFTSTKRALRNPDGTPLVLNGVVQYEEGTAVGLSNSMREFGAVDKAIFVLGGWAPNWLTGDTAKDATVDGLFLYMESPGGGTGLDAEFAAVWAAAPAQEKEAAAAAVAKSYEAMKGLMVEVTTAAGTQAQGVLKQVLKATPYGAASAAVDAIVTVAKDGKTEDVQGTIVAPFTTLPGPATP